MSSLNSKKIELLPKNINPANAPKTRLIEDFWAVLKAKVYEKIFLNFLEMYKDKV
jgi:hypothetical protein